ncbi:hypothetical protein 7t3_0245 [Salmonella phage 7t3]|nr:hypothetical protein 7t3_0245 [Salmonella phage 7t3]
MYHLSVYMSLHSFCFSLFLFTKQRIISLTFNDSE